MASGLLEPCARRVKKRTSPEHLNQVCFTPKNAHCGYGSKRVLSAKSERLGRLFDHLISSSAYRLCDCQAKRLCGREIDDQLKFGGLINWNVARFCPAEDLVHIIGKALGEFAEIGRISHQPSQVHIVAVWITDRETVFLGQFNDQYSLR